jgi:hypothetical protein
MPAYLQLNASFAENQRSLCKNRTFAPSSLPNHIHFACLPSIIHSYP